MAKFEKPARNRDVVFEEDYEDDLEPELSVSVAARTSEKTGLAALCSQFGDALLAGEDFESMMRAILNRAFDLIPAQRGSICLCGEQPHQLLPVVSRRGPAAVPISISSSITQKVLQEERAILVMDAGEDSLLGMAESIAAMNIQSVMCAPMYHNGVVQGLIYLDTVTSRRRFFVGDSSRNPTSNC